MITLLKWVRDVNISSKPLILAENLYTSPSQWRHDQRSIEFWTVEHWNWGHESRSGSHALLCCLCRDITARRGRGYPLSKKSYCVLKHRYSFKLIHKRSLFFESWRRRFTRVYTYTCILRYVNKGTQSYDAWLLQAYDMYLFCISILCTTF
jgi:hypothetical protein